MKDKGETSNGIEESMNKLIEMPKKQTSYLAIVNDETGEVESFIRLETKKLGKHWVALYQQRALCLAQQNLTGEQFKVLYYLLGKLDFDNYLRVSLKEIADWINLKVPNVSRAMKALKELEIIIEGPMSGKFKTYRFNPEIAHKGKNRKNTLIEFEKFKKMKEQEKSKNISDNPENV